jgi:hypothetical protein
LCDTDNKEGSQEIGEILEEIKENLPPTPQKEGRMDEGILKGLKIRD